MKLSCRCRHASIPAITVLVLVTTAILFVLSACGEARSPNEPGAPAVTPAPTVATGTARLTVDDIPRVTIDELLQKMASNANIVIVDTRQSFEYDEEHIRGAISASLAAIASGEWLPPPYEELIFYCT